MADERLIVGIYLDPPFWLANDGEKITAGTLTPAECLEIVFSKKLQNGIDVCAQRQGFVVAAIPKELIDPAMQSYTSNLLPSNAARFANDFFNAFLYMFDDQLYRNNSSTMRQSIVTSDLWRWPDKIGVDLTEIAIGQPMPIHSQSARIAPDSVLFTMGKTIGLLSKENQIFRLTCSTTLIDSSFNSMFVGIGDYLLNWQLMALLNKAIMSTQRGEFAEAHILCWAVAEKLIDIEWKNYAESTNEIFDDGARSINSERKKTLNNGRDFTASVRAEILELAKVIPYELYRRLAPIRTARNNWMHNLGPISLKDCRDCYAAARDLLSRKLGFEIQHPGGYYLFDEDIRQVESSQSTTPPTSPSARPSASRSPHNT